MNQATLSTILFIGFIILMVMIAWWMIGGILSITLGDLLVYAIIFFIGYSLGSTR